MWITLSAFKLVLFFWLDMRYDYVDYPLWYEFHLTCLFRNYGIYTPFNYYEMSLNINIEPGNIVTNVTTARSSGIGGTAGPTSSNPTKITNFFKPSNTGKPIHKKIVQCDSVCNQSNVYLSSKEIPLVPNEHHNVPIYQSYYPKMYCFKYNTCKNARCKLCPMADTTQIGKNTLYKTFCKTYNCVYLLRCTICHFGYIGQTKNHLNIRINLHRSQIKNASQHNSGLPSYEIAHFADHGIENLTVKIIDIIRDENTRKWWENLHIQQFQTLYPYGLNTLYYDKPVNVSSYTNSNKHIHEECAHHYVAPHVKRHLRGRKHKKSSFDITMVKLSDLVNKLMTLNVIKKGWIKNFVYGIRKNLIVKLYFHCKNTVNRVTVFSTTIYDMIIDYMKIRAIYHNINLTESNTAKTTTKEYCIVRYINKALDSIPYASIFRNIKHLFPLNFIHISVSFKYNLTVGRAIFNYNNISKNLNLFKPNICNCNVNSTGYNPHHQHVITGSLNIVNDLNLRKIMQNGTSYRLEQSVNIEHSINEQLDFFIYGIAIKYSLPLNAFDEWKHAFIQQFLNHYPNHYKINNIKLSSLKPAISDLQEQYVITYLDKVSTNYAFTCKTYYINKLSQYYNDLNLYAPTTESERSIKNKITALYKKAGYIIKNLKFPYLVLVPKLHKDPVKFRPVTVGCNTYLTLANEKLLIILNKLLEIIKKEGSYFVKNSYEVVNLLNQCNVVTVTSYDFADLFNTIDIKTLYSIMLKFFEQYDIQQFISYTKFKSLLTIVLNENVLFNGIGFYRQINGIPMGGGCSSALADLYLHHYEIGNHILNELLYIRYVDDILIGYTHDNFIFSFDFYPSNLKLIETEKNSNNSLDFLDLNILYKNNMLHIRIYDKRDAFNFKINRITSWHSCIHKNIFRNIIINQLTRCNKIFSDSEEKYSFIVKYLQVAIDNKYPHHFLTKIILNFYKLDTKSIYYQILNRLNWPR